MVKHALHQEVHMNIPHHKLHKLAHGHRVQLEHHELMHGPNHLILHHLHHKKIHHSRINHKGMRLGPLTEHEIMSSGSLKSIWEGVKSGFNKYVKPVLSGVGDAIAYTNPELAPLRESVRKISGIGLHKKHAKGSEHMKERMAKVRAAKKHTGGSFLLR